MADVKRPRPPSFKSTRKRAVKPRYKRRIGFTNGEPELIPVSSGEVDHVNGDGVRMDDHSWVED